MKIYLFQQKKRIDIFDQKKLIILSFFFGKCGSWPELVDTNYIQ
jgi:hypothetical protein